MDQLPWPALPKCSAVITPFECMNSTSVSIVDEIRAMLLPAVSDVFATMFGINVRPGAVQDIPLRSSQSLLLGSVGFVGDINGVVYICLTDAFARKLSGRLLGLSVEQIEDEMVNDVVGEIGNMVVGTIKSQLCDRGTLCVLTIPSVLRGTNLTIERSQSADCRIIGVRVNEDYFQLELLIKKKLF